MSAFSCIPFIFMTIDMSSSSKISESAEWKVLHEKKKKWQLFVFFIWLISQNSVRFTYATTLFQVWEFVKIGFWVLAFLTYRDRVPFCPGFVSLIYLLWMFHDKKLTPL